MKVDFHVHSTASDGTRTPSELAWAARGFAALALTDHDNMDGTAECAAACAAAGVPFVAGIELSIEPGAGFDKFHLLGLGVDPQSAALKAFLRRVLEGRRERNARIFMNFAGIGIDIAPSEIARYAHGDIVARPHFAQWLTDHGYAATVKEAFDRFLLPSSPADTRCYEERWHPAQEDAFRAVHEAGGLCIMAHPKYWRREWRDTGPDFEAAQRELARLREAGLDGVEAIYQANTPQEDAEFSRIAAKLGFLLSAGSDFHGSNKPSISLGMEVDDRFAGPLVSALGLDK